MTDDAGRLALQTRLATLGVPYELFPCDPALADTAAFCAAYGFAPEDSANTIVVVGKGLADGTIEVKDRRTGEREEIPADHIVDHLVRVVRA